MTPAQWIKASRQRDETDLRARLLALAREWDKNAGVMSYESHGRAARDLRRVLNG